MKPNKIIQFPEYLLRDWEASDGVNFAVALSRITGWLLHVDWWSPTDNNEAVENMKSLRVYVGNNANQVYDLKGIQTIATFSQNIIKPIAQKRGVNHGGIATRYYSENQLFNLPLRVKPDEDRIHAVQKLVILNTDFLEKIPKRQEPNIPAHIAAKFTFGYCNPFANALSDLKGYKPVAIIAKEYNRLFHLNKPGYIHSFTLDKDGNSIDIWGKDTIENITQRFGATKYYLDESEHFKVTQTLKSNSPKKYQEIYEESITIIKKFFM